MWSPPWQGPSISGSPGSTRRCIGASTRRCVDASTRRCTDASTHRRVDGRIDASTCRRIEEGPSVSGSPGAAAVAATAKILFFNEGWVGIWMSVSNSIWCLFRTQIDIRFELGFGTVGCLNIDSHQDRKLTQQKHCFDRIFYFPFCFH